MMGRWSVFGDMGASSKVEAAVTEDLSGIRTMSAAHGGNVRFDA
jgi:hypothetical protein